MKTKTLLTASVTALAMLMASCATTQGRGDASRLAAYEAYLQPAVKSIRYTQARNWEKLTDQHLLLETRPKEHYLLKLDGPCLQFSNGSPGLIVDAQMTGMLAAGTDRIGTINSGITCLIREIRPVDSAAMQTAVKP